MGNAVLKAEIAGQFFPADGSGPRDYEEGRTEQAFIDYINGQAGTHRTAGGLLNELVRANSDEAHGR